MHQLWTLSFEAVTDHCCEHPTSVPLVLSHGHLFRDSRKLLVGLVLYQCIYASCNMQ